MHVIDGSHPLAYAQRENVLDVLNRLDVKPELMDNIINVVNKIDKMYVVVQCSAFPELLIF